jgi:CubicO group peptidase (beta-lactamase class C family)
LAVLLLSLPAFGEEEGLESLVRSDVIDCAVREALESGLINGAVVFVGDSSNDLFLRAYGSLSPSPDAPLTEVDTIFDLASLTKVFATAPSVMKLVEDGRLGLYDPVAKWFPEFAGKGKDSLLIFHLLTHTSGLVDFSLSGCTTMQEVVERAAGLELRSLPGDRFKYADINFILLGELVGRVSGVPLIRYAADNFFAPLGMIDTRFNPPEEVRSRCAATRIEGDCLLYGAVQDPNARILGGAAGHAGLFGTAADLSRFCRMILRGGELDGKRLLAERTIRRMTSPNFFHDGKVVRGLGWDIASPYSSPRGKLFSCASFGHTGYSGCSVWIDPDSNLFVGILVSRRDYRKNGALNRLRGTVSTLAAALFFNPTHRKCRENSPGCAW